MTILSTELAFQTAHNLSDITHCTLNKENTRTTTFQPPDNAEVDDLLCYCVLGLYPFCSLLNESLLVIQKNEYINEK